MRICLALTAYLPEVYGGAEVYTRRLAAALKGRGHEVRVATLDFVRRHGRASDEVYEGVPVHRMAYDFAYRPPPIYALQLFPEIYDEAQSWLARAKPDVVHVTNAWFLPAFALGALHAGIPVVGTHVDFLWFCRESHFLRPDGSSCPGPPEADPRPCYADLTDAQWARVSRQRDDLTRVLAQGYAFHHCPSALLAAHVRRAGAAADTVGVWPYGVPSALAEARVEKSASDALRLASIGRWNRIKGIDLLLDAMECIEDDLPVMLKLFGDREAWNRDTFAQEQTTRAEGLSNVQIMGRFAPERLSEIHRDIDCLVLPSTWPENAPVAILEALAMGTPVICADGAGMTPLIQDGENGLVFRSRDAGDLARQIVKLAGSPALRRKLAAGARCQRTIEEDARAFEGIYGRSAAPRGERWREQSQNLIDTARAATETYLSGRTDGEPDVP